MQTPSQAQKNKYWFVLGRESLIAAAEISAVLNNFKYEFKIPILKTEDKIDPKILINRLGGTIKIAEEILDDASDEEVINTIVAELKTVEGKINFGISMYGDELQRGALITETKKLGLKIKKILKNEKYSVRYVENREPVLSSVTVEKNGLTARGREFLISVPANGKNYSAAVTRAVQPFEEFSLRDYGRPGRDDASGMLPPKLAMMMINISKCPKAGVLLDPFCGSGTIITEAMLLGFKKLSGSDISDKAIEDCKKNIEWISGRNKTVIDYAVPEIYQLDVNKLTEKKSSGSVGAIVTEPFLGKPLRGGETKMMIVAQIEELKKLYLEAFRQFYKILKPGGIVNFIIPRFRLGNDWIRIDCENEIKKIGFETEKLFENYTSLLYARPDQRVGREIWMFRKI